MAAVLHLDTEQAVSRRGKPRRALRLELEGVSIDGSDLKVVVHDLSVTGVLIEVDAPLMVGDIIRLDMPEGGAVDTEVMWSSGRFHGCQFDEEVSNATLSAALLRGAVGFKKSDLADHTKAIAHEISQLPEAHLELPADQQAPTALERVAAIALLAAGIWVPLAFGAAYLFG